MYYYFAHQIFFNKFDLDEYGICEIIDFYLYKGIVCIFLWDGIMINIVKTRNT